MTKALVFLVPGFEEIETSTIVDVLRRCGVKVTVAGLTMNSVEGAHKMKFLPDITIDKVPINNFDALVLPGGSPGYKNLRKEERIINMIRDFFGSNKLVAAVCASPAVLSDSGVLRGKRCTIYPGMEYELEKGGGIPIENAVVVDGNVITSRGPATALAFALKIAEKLVGREVTEKVSKDTLANVTIK